MPWPDTGAVGVPYITVVAPPHGISCPDSRVDRALLSGDKWGHRCRPARVRCIVRSASDPRPQAGPVTDRRSTGWSRVTKMLASYAGRRVVRIESGPREVVLDFDPDAMPIPTPGTAEES